MKAENPSLCISILVNCPNCDNLFDLFDLQNLTEDSYLHTLVLSDNGHYSNFGCEKLGEKLKEDDIEIHCPECKCLVEIESINW